MALHHATLFLPGGSSFHAWDYFRGELPQLFARSEHEIDPWNVIWSRKFLENLRPALLYVNGWKYP